MNRVTAIMLANSDTAVAVWQLLLTDAPRLVVATVSMAIGFASLLVQLLRWKSPERIRLWFGLLALLYGYRALLMTRSAQLFLSRDAVESQIALVTFTIGIPAILFGWGLVDRKHNLVTKSLLAVNALMALTFLALFSNDAAVRLLFLANSVLVVGFTGGMIAFLYWLPTSAVADLKTLRVVLLVWGAFVVYNNIRGFLPFAPSADYEFVGFAIFLCSLAYLVARRSIATEEALAAIRNELEIARRIQSTILPDQMPQLAGLQVAAQYVPMSEVAGDFYDFLVVGQHGIGLLISDVSGHGIPAALVASMVKVAIAAQVDHADKPAEVIAGLNSVLSGKLQGQFVTAAYLFLDLEKGTGCYSAAGHPPLLHYRAADRTVESVVENGLILGVIPLASYEAKVLQIGKGDRFLLYTDGVVEASQNGEEFGEARVKDVLARDHDANAICQSITSEITAWTQGIPGDDVTLIAVTIA
ncbi:MAG TPA: PP2C family protein-serine/threonine phosphatase [Terriglobales bacterium]|nr:PP2C family protein-serine/threonine phosphatase [Terriglobales bacterium]